MTLVNIDTKPTVLKSNSLTIAKIKLLCTINLNSLIITFMITVLIFYFSFPHNRYNAFNIIGCPPGILS